MMIATNDDHLQDLFRNLLETSVKSRIIRMKERGGATIEDYQRITGHIDLIGVQPLFSKRDEGEIAQEFNQIAEALAVLSFTPTGIDFLGLHFQATDLPPIMPETIASLAAEQLT